MLCETNLMDFVSASVIQINQRDQQNSVFIEKFTGNQDIIETWGGHFWETILHGFLPLLHVFF